MKRRSSQPVRARARRGDTVVLGFDQLDRDTLDNLALDTREASRRLGINFVVVPTTAIAVARPSVRATVIAREMSSSRREPPT